MQRLELIRQSVSQPPPSMDNLQTLQTEVKGSVATIWFNKQPSLNSISIRMTHEFVLVLSVLDANPDAKLILIRSRHPKVFSVGADLKDVFFNPEAKNNTSMFVLLERTFKSVRKPVISVVEGMAFGGGFEIALLSDIILCSDKATFRFPEITLGIFPGLGGTQVFTRLVGTKLSMEKILTGSSLTAAEAANLDIVVKLPSQNFQQRVTEFSEKLLNKASDSLQAAKQAINSSQETTLEQGLLQEASVFQGLFNKGAAREGLSAFAERRKPNFRGM